MIEIKKWQIMNAEKKKKTHSDRQSWTNPLKCQLELNFLNVTMFGIKWATSWENLFMPYVKNKDSDQTVRIHTVWSAIFCPLNW